MAWTTPVTWTTSLALSVARLNEQLRDNLNYLYALWAASGWGYNLSRNGSMRGWQGGTSAAPDAWVKSGTGATVAREGTTVKIGTYSAKLTNQAAAAAYLTQSLPGDLYKQLLGKTVVFGAWVYCSAASRAMLTLVCTDGTNLTSGYHTGGGGWEFITASGTVNAATTAISLRLDIVAGDAISVYWDGVTLTEGTLATSYVQGFNDWAPRLLWRQNSSGTNYKIGGGLLMQVGLTAADTGNLAITFPSAFSAAPFLVLCDGSYRNNYTIEDVATTGFTAYKTAGSSSSGVYWLAIGLE